jgi:hypothetical protein
MYIYGVENPNLGSQLMNWLKFDLPDNIHLYTDIGIFCITNFAGVYNIMVLYSLKL